MEYYCIFAVNGMGTPSPPLPPSPTKGVAPNSSPAFDNFMRLMQGRGASPMMQVPPGFAPQQQPQQQQPSQGHFFHHQAQQQPQHQHMFRPNGMRPPPQNQFFFAGAPLTRQMVNLLNSLVILKRRKTLKS